MKEKIQFSSYKFYSLVGEVSHVHIQYGMSYKARWDKWPGEEFKEQKN